MFFRFDVVADFGADVMPARCLRAGVCVGEYSDNGEWLLLEVELLNEQALCGR